MKVGSQVTLELVREGLNASVSPGMYTTILTSLRDGENSNQISFPSHLSALSIFQLSTSSRPGDSQWFLKESLK